MVHRRTWRINSLFEKLWKESEFENFFLKNEHVFSEMVLEINLVRLLAQQYIYLILAATQKEFAKYWPQVFSFPDQAQEQLEHD